MFSCHYKTVRYQIPVLTNTVDTKKNAVQLPLSDNFFTLSSLTVPTMEPFIIAQDHHGDDAIRNRKFRARTDVGRKSSGLGIFDNWKPA